MSPEERQNIIDNLWDGYNGIIMEYQKLINLLYNAPNSPSKFGIKNGLKDMWKA